MGECRAVPMYQYVGMLEKVVLGLVRAQSNPAWVGLNLLGSGRVKSTHKKRPKKGLGLPTVWSNSKCKILARGHSRFKPLSFFVAPKLEFGFGGRDRAEPEVHKSGSG